MTLQDKPQQDHSSARGSSGRFGFTLTPSLQEFLANTPQGVAALQDLLGDQGSSSSQDAAAAGPPVVPWRVLQEACRQQQQQQQQQRPQQQEQQQQQQSPDAPSSSSSSPECPAAAAVAVAAAAAAAAAAAGPSTAAALVCGSSLVLPGPRPRQRSKALQERLATLQERLDAAAYAAMVSDVTPDEAAAAAARDEPFLPTTKLQLSFGLHVLVTMGTFFALGWYGGRFITHSDTWAALCGCLGLVSGLLLETSLLIIRLNAPPPLDQRYGHLMDKSWQTRSKQQQQGQQRGPAEGGAAAKGRKAPATAGGDVVRLRQGSKAE